MDLHEKIGPLEVWQWIAIVGAAAVIYWYVKREPTESVYGEPSESFATGSSVGQGAEGGGGAGSEEALPPFPAEGYLPSLGNGEGERPIEGLNTELGELAEARELLAATGLIAPQGGANKSPLNRRLHHQHKEIGKLEKQVHHLRKQPTHAKAGDHSHRKHQKPTKKHAKQHDKKSNARAERRAQHARQEAAKKQREMERQRKQHREAEIAHQREAERARQATQEAERHHHKHRRKHRR